MGKPYKVIGIAICRIAVSVNAVNFEEAVNKAIANISGYDTIEVVEPIKADEFEPDSVVELPENYNKLRLLTKQEMRS